MFRADWAVTPRSRRQGGDREGPLTGPHPAGTISVMRQVVVLTLVVPLALGWVTACSGGPDAGPRDESACYRWSLEVNLEPGIGDDRAWIFEHQPEVLAEG